MGLPEIAWRIGQNVRIQLERAGIGLASRTPQPTGRAGCAWLAKLPAGFDSAPYISAAERILSGRFDVFAMRDVFLGFPPQWNRDPRTGIEAPLVLGKTLDYRVESIVGDIKYLWEPNRHLELVALAQAFHLSGEQRYIKGVQRLLESWFENCPYPLGPNWTSSLENAIRLVNWSFTWHLIGGENSPLFLSPEGQVFKQRWLASIYQHMHFILGQLSFFSSANNHLLGEYMGLFIGSVTWPLWKECQAWSECAKNGLEQEALKQNASDGVNREQATWYHHEVADMILLCGLFGRANGIMFSSAYWGLLTSMLEYIASIMDVAGHVPMIGDADDAVMARLSQESGFNVYRSLLATGAVLFNREEFKTKAGRFDDKSRWLLGDSAAQKFGELPVAWGNLPVRRAFPDGGYYVLGSKYETEDEVRIVADVGPLGYLSIAAHGHADALSFTLSVKGVELLVDPGTYSYHNKNGWRDYFRGTSAHNTLVVDSANQSEIGGTFLWLRHARGRLVDAGTGPEGEQWVTGVHDGYMRLGVSHTRRIELSARGDVVTVSDEIAGNGEHELAIYFHFAPDIELTPGPQPDSWQAAKTGSRIRVLLEVDETWLWETVRGSESPKLGWYSASLGVKVPVFTLRGSRRVQLPVQVDTRIVVQ